MVEELFKNMHLQLSAEDIRKIDEWKIAHGMKSRTEAIRAMIRIVTTGNIDEGDLLGSFAEKERPSFIRPEGPKQKNENIEETVRKLVKEELQKILNNK